MSCRKILEIDLPAFLAEASGAEFAAFREHYPTCAECSAEVRAWTELHDLLSADRPSAEAAHPAEELLLRFEENPAALPASERRSVEAHLALCRSCKDELRALRGFDFASLEERPAPEPPAWREALETFLVRVRGLALHPAFAYALVLILLYPTIQREWRDSTFGQPEPSGPTLAEQSLEETPAERRPPSAIERPRAPMAEPPSHRADEPPAPAPAEPPEAALEKAAPRANVPERTAPEERKREMFFGRSADGRASFEQAPLRTDRVGAGELRAAKRSAITAPIVRQEADALAEPEIQAITLERGELAEIYAAQVRGGLRLALPVPSAAQQEGTEVEVRVLAPEGKREIRERFQLGAGQTQVEVRLPAEWISEGTHQVELRLIDPERPTAPAFESRFRIR